MSQPRDITDQPGALPGEDSPALPPIVQAFCDEYDVPIFDHEDGTTPTVRVSATVWCEVSKAARRDDKLRALLVHTDTAGVHLVAVVDVGDAAVTMAATAVATVPRTIVNLVDL